MIAIYTLTAHSNAIDTHTVALDCETLNKAHAEARVYAQECGGDSVVDLYVDGAYAARYSRRGHGPVRKR